MTLLKTYRDRTHPHSTRRGTAYPDYKQSSVSTWVSLVLAYSMDPVARTATDMGRKRYGNNSCRNQQDQRDWDSKVRKAVDKPVDKRVDKPVDRPVDKPAGSKVLDHNKVLVDNMVQGTWDFSNRRLD